MQLGVLEIAGQQFEDIQVQVKLDAAGWQIDGVNDLVGGHFTIARVRAESPQPSLIATVGLSLALMEYLRVVQSPVTVWLPPLPSVTL